MRDIRRFPTKTVSSVVEAIKQRAGLLPAVCAAILSSCAALLAEGFEVDPFVTTVDPDRVTMVWVSNPDTPAAQVMVVPAAGGQPQTFTPRQDVPPFMSDQASPDKPDAKLGLDFVRNIASIGGLLPATHYKYRVATPRGDISVTGEFRTAPVAGADTPFKFIMFTDTHVAHGAAPESISDSGASFVMIGGDLVNRGQLWRQWKEFFSTGRPYLGKMTVLPVIGGHDIEFYNRGKYIADLGGRLPLVDGAQIFPAHNYRAIWCQAEPELEMPHNEDFFSYSKVFGNLRYIGIDHWINKTEMKKLIAWLEKELQKNTSTWTVVCLHDPCFAVGSRGGVGRRSYFTDLFEKYGVDFVFSGHNHIYERFMPMGQPGKKPVQYVNINTNGGINRPARPSPILAGGAGWRGKCYAEFSVAGNKLTMVSKTAEGEEFDRLELVKDENGLFQEDYMRQSITREKAIEIAHIYSSEGRAKNRELREDIQIEFAAAPRAGAVLKAKLDTSNFPRGSKLIVERVDDPAGWRTTAREYTVEDSPTEIEITPPASYKLDEEGKPQPALSLTLSFEQDGRRYNTSTIEPTLGAKTIELLKQ